MFVITHQITLLVTQMKEALKSSLRYLSALPLALFVLLIFGVSLTDADEAASGGKIFVVFRHDDPSALSDLEHEQRVMEIFQRYQIPQTFGIIPNVAKDCNNSNCSEFHLLNENELMLNLLDKWHKQGFIEIALHGYTHRTNSLYPTKEQPKEYSEFRGLPYEEQFQRISRGKQFLDAWFGVPVRTFILPWNSHDENTILAAKAAGIELVSSTLESWNNPLNTQLYSDPLLIQHTTELGKFKQALSLARRYTKQNDKPAFIIVLYHSHLDLKRPEDFQLLEDITKEVAQSADIAVMTLENFGDKFSQALKDLILVKREAKSAIQRVDRIFSFMGRERPESLSTEFGVFDVNYYVNQKKQAHSLYRNFHLAVISIGILVSIFYFGLIKLRLVRRRLALYLLFLCASLWIFYSFIGYFGLFGLEAGIGIIDSIVLILLGVVLIGLFTGYFSISRAELNNSKPENKVRSDVRTSKIALRKA